MTFDWLVVLILLALVIIFLGARLGKLEAKVEVLEHDSELLWRDRAKTLDHCSWSVKTPDLGRAIADGLARNADREHALELSRQLNRETNETG